MMVYHLAIAVWILLVCTACNPPSSAERDTVAGQGEVPRGLIGTALPTSETTVAAHESTTTPTTFASRPSDNSSIAWEGLTIAIPPQHVWDTASFPLNNGVAAPVVSQGRIAFDRTRDTANAVELPDGIGFSIVQFAGGADAWLESARNAAPQGNPVDPASVRQTTIADRPARAYSYTVTGVSRSETIFVELTSDRALVMTNSDADNATYRAVLDALTISAP